MWGLTAADFLTIAGAVMYLIVLEGLLSADNALVLALMVRHLPEASQRRALRYGIVGAFVFRFIAIIFASYMLGYWWLKVLGGLYLLYIAIVHLVRGEDEPEVDGDARFGRGFWATVVRVEFADIAFSIDSILAAVSTSEALPDAIGDLQIGFLGFEFLDVRLLVVYLGGVLGIITMRMVAGLFLRILKRFSGLATGAYVMVAWIGLHLVGGGLHMAFHPERRAPAEWVNQIPGTVRHIPWEMPDWLFWTGMGAILVVSLIYRPKHDPTSRLEKAIEMESNPNPTSDPSGSSNGPDA